MKLPKWIRYWTPQRIELLLLALTLLATVLISALTFRQTTRQFEITNEHFQVERTDAFVARFNSPEMVQLREQVDRWLETGESASELHDRSLGKPVDPANPNSALPAEQALETVARLRTLTNYFQEFGTALKAGSLNERYAHELLGAVCVRYATSLKPFILETRKRRPQQPLAYEEVFLLKSRMESWDKKP